MSDTKIEKMKDDKTGDIVSCNSIEELNEKILDAKQTIKGHFSALGEKYYDAVISKESTDKLQFIVDEITLSKTRIEKMEARIKELQGLVKCSVCGKESEADSTFCIYCGNRLKEEAVVTCSKCGKELVEDGKFCPYCGAEVEAVEEAPKDAGEEKEEKEETEEKEEEIPVEKEIAEVVQEHSEEQQRVCPHCGMGIEEDSVFCGYCGYPAGEFKTGANEDRSTDDDSGKESEAPAETSGNIYCTECGAVIDEDSKFCSFCGCKLT